MNAIPSTILAIATLALVSCGPSAEEIATKEKQKIDSITKTTEEATRQKIADESRLKDSIETDKKSKADAEMDKENLKQSLSDARTELRLATEKLAEIKQFHTLRTAAEKEQQITAQYKVIQQWEDEIERKQEELKKY